MAGSSCWQRLAELQACCREARRQQQQQRMWDKVMLLQCSRSRRRGV